MTKLGQIARNVGAALIAVPIVILAVPLALVSGLVTTLTGERKRHDQAWGPMRGRNADGLTAFQALCERRLVETVEAGGVSLAGRNVKPTTHRGKPMDELWIEWSIEGTPLTIGIYPNGAGIWGEKIDDRFEEWDARTPDELMEIFAERVVRRATESRQAVSMAAS